MISSRPSSQSNRIRLVAVKLMIQVSGILDLYICIMQASIAVARMAYVGVYVYCVQ